MARATILARINRLLGVEEEAVVPATPARAQAEDVTPTPATPAWAQVEEVALHALLKPRPTPIKLALRPSRSGSRRSRGWRRPRWRLRPQKRW